MKKTVFTLMAGVALLMACTPAQQKTIVTGTLNDAESDTLLASYYPIGDLERKNLKQETVVLNGGQFTLELANDSTPTAITFYAKPQPDKAASLVDHAVHTVAFPGQKITISGTMTDYRVEGNEFHSEYAQITKQCKQQLDKMDAIVSAIVAAQNTNSFTPELSDSLRQDYMTAQNELMTNYKNYISQNPNSNVSLYLLNEMGYEYAKELLPTLSDNVKNGPLASLYQAMDEAVQKEKAREEASKKIVEGAEAPDFTLKDLNGKDLALSSLRGKYVVLDFWGSWCGWCIKGIPDMKKYYEKYKGKMEILGIDCRDTEEKWKAAVEKHELPWLHVRNEGNPDVSLLYAIQGYPTKIVIDPEGKIAKVVIGEDPAFYEYLDELFK